MAQAYIKHVVKRNKHLENQIKELRNQTEFNESDNELLMQAVDEIENKFNLKRKADCTEKQNKKPKLQLTCDLCDKVFKHIGTLNRHLNTHFMKFECKTCNKSFTRKSNLKKHNKKCANVKSNSLEHSPSVGSKETKTVQTKKKGFTCKHCGLLFDDYDGLFHHVTSTHPLNQSGGNLQQHQQQDVQSPTIENESNNNEKRVRFNKSAIDGKVNQTSIIPHGNEKYDLLQFLANVKDEIKEELILQRTKQRSIKWYVNARVEMIRDIDDGNQEKAYPHFRSITYISLPEENNDHNLNEAFQSINKALEEFIKKGSNWTLNKVISLEIHTVTFSPIPGSSYMELPRKIRFTRGIVNIKNNDQKCFLWSVLAALHPAQHNPQEIYHYKVHENSLNFDGIPFPVSLTEMGNFEKQNNISINVFGYEEGEVFPLYLTKLGNGHKEIDLLYLSKEENSHYCWIKNLDHFLGSRTKFSNKRFYCRRCLHGFTRRDLLMEHRPYCDKFDFQKVEYPKKGKEFLEFKDFEKQMPVPFVIYADFEAYARKLDSCQPDPEKPSTTHRTKFEACGFSYILVCSNDKYTKPPVVYRGENAVEHFFENILKEEEFIQEILSNPEPLIMNEESEKAFQNTTHCNVCNRQFTDKIIKVRDHDHLGVEGDINDSTYTNYRQACCQRCNLSQKSTFIPCYFHNLRGFDAHLLMSAAGKYKDKKITVIAQNSEKYISFSIGKLRFLDSFQCMGSSLETLVNNLAADGLQHFNQFRKAFPSDETAKLLLQKNEYCYDYVDCEQKFKETQLPPKEAFYNSLTKESISDEKYQHAEAVWNHFNMKTLGDFHDLYVLTDCLLLCDVFQKFRQMTLENYKLDACHFYTSPGLAWQAALKMTGICLELITDPVMYNMIELGTRGGVSMVSQKYCKANHEKLSDYDPTKPSKHIMYLDMNNLYGYSMQSFLGHGGFHFLTDEEIQNFDLQKIPENSNKGYILEVDLEYPSELHDEHNCYPLAPSHEVIEDEQLSQYSQTLWEKLNKTNDIVSPSESRKEDGKTKPRIKTKKLVPTLKNKTNYIVHYENLKLYQKLGLKIRKIHRILEFQQSQWLKKYIEFNAEMRKMAKNDFEKDFFKLMCNSVFGKCLENLRQRICFHLINSPKTLRKYVAKPSFERIHIFNEDLVGVQNKVVSLILNKPIYVGQAILDLSKKAMYEFHYNVMKPMYGENIKLLFTDTDSLCYEVQTQDVYKDMHGIKDLLDTSNYPKDHHLFTNRYKKVPGKMKDELGGIPIHEFVGLRPKMYSLKYDVKNKDEKGEEINVPQEKKVAKGVVKNVIKKTLRHEQFKQCLFGEVNTVHSMNVIRSKNHELFMDTLVKNTLSGFDDKKYWLNNIHSLSFGHYKI